MSDKIPKGFEKYGDKAKSSPESSDKTEKKPLDFKGFNFGGGNKDNRFLRI